MKITNELMLEFQKQHQNDFKFRYFGENFQQWEVYPSNIRCIDADCLFAYHPVENEISIYSGFHSVFDITRENFYIDFSGCVSIKTWEEFKIYMKRYNAFERAVIKFKKDIAIETKKLDLEEDFDHANDD